MNTLPRRPPARTRDRSRGSSCSASWRSSALERPHRPPVLPAGRQRRPVRRAGRGATGRRSQAIPSTRGLIYDRIGRRARHERADVRREDPAGRPARGPARRGRRPAVRPARRSGRRHQRGDRRQPRLAVRPRPGRPDVPKETANLIAEAGFELPGRRGRRRGAPPVRRWAAPVARSSATPVRSSAEQLETLKDDGLPAGRPPGQDRPRGVLRGASCAARTASRRSSGRVGPRSSRCSRRSARRRRATRSGSRSTRSEQKLAQKALEWGMKAAGLKRGVVIVMNPQTGEILAMVSLPTYDNNAFARGHQHQGLRELLVEPGQAAPQPRDQRPLPARLHVQARGRDRRPRRQEDHADARGSRRGRT